MKLLLLMISCFALTLTAQADCSGPTKVTAEYAKSDLAKVFPNNKAVLNAKLSADCKVGWLSKVLPGLEIKKNHDLLMSCGLMITFDNQEDMEQLALEIYQANNQKESLSTLDAYGIAEVAVPVCGVIK